MPFYTGVANSFADLQTALFTACVAQGWSQSGDVLTKGSAAIKALVNDVDVSDVLGIGLYIQGGTGVSSGSLVNPCAPTPRLGPMQTGDIQPTWPMEYYLHIFTNPDEVYLIAKFSVDYYYWLAFGVSNTPGLGASANGLWLSATSSAAAYPTASPQIAIDITLSAYQKQASTAPFWKTYINNGPAVRYNTDAICVDLEGILWTGNPASTALTNIFSNGSHTAAFSVIDLLNRQPNAWSGDSTLHPIRPHYWFSGSKCAPVADFVNARYMRIDNYAPGDIISLGPDQWRVYPFYHKNASARNGGVNINHSGTFGWAIRYDGS